MRRARFVTGAAGALGIIAGLPSGGLAEQTSSRSQNASDADPASTALQPSLRVLLGNGVAQPLPDGGFTYDGRTYRGNFSYAPGGEVINFIGLEEYLYSVVPREMPPGWPAAALQVQAICARTYVLQRSDPRRAYDVVPSELDQVYEGIATESAAGRVAVDSTSGLTLRYGSAFAEIAYSSCCGGHTESSGDAWGGIAQPYLSGVLCSYCTASPDYRWSRDIPLSVVANAMASQLAGIGALRDVQLGQRDASGRARTFELFADHGSVEIRGSDFRIAVGTRLMRSLLVLKLAVQPSANVPASPTSTPAVPVLHIEGAGLGHGVGLCQWGARGYAIAGASAAQIASFYCPGTTIGDNRAPLPK